MVNNNPPLVKRSSLHITVPDNKIPIVSVSSACKSISANRESFDRDTRLKTNRACCFVSEVERQFFFLTLFSPFSLYFFLFSIFSFFFFSFLFFSFRTRIRRERKGDWRRRKEDWTDEKWRRQEVASSFDFSTLSFSRAISPANRWSNPSLDSI